MPLMKIRRLLKQRLAAHPSHLEVTAEPYTSQSDPTRVPADKRMRLQKIVDVRAGAGLARWVKSNRKRIKQGLPELPPPDGRGGHGAYPVRGLLLSSPDQNVPPPPPPSSPSPHTHTHPSTRSP